MKTSELTGAALDWAVAKCGGGGNFPESFKNAHAIGRSNYSTNWAHGGPIIEREMREFGFDLWSGVHVPDGHFAATYCRGAPDSYVYGPTPLTAAMRCYVASKLGDEVEIPEELT
jgi:hypothetical protein